MLIFVDIRLGTSARPPLMCSQAISLAGLVIGIGFEGFCCPEGDLRVFLVIQGKGGIIIGNETFKCQARFQHILDKFIKSIPNEIQKRQRS